MAGRKKSQLAHQMTAKLNPQPAAPAAPAK